MNPVHGRPPSRHRVPLPLEGLEVAPQTSPAPFPPEASRPKPSSPYMSNPLANRIFVPNFRQLACLACGQITLIPPATFPPAFTAVESLSPTGDYLPNVCLCHQTLSSTRVGALSFSLLSPHGSFTPQIFAEHLPCDSCCAKCFNIIVKKKTTTKIPALWSLPSSVERETISKS